jgi:serine/threonine protein kinase
MSLVGEALGSYRILEELSSGGMGTVYRAEHELLARPAAVKVLRATMTGNPDIVSRFFTEARAASAIRHPAIVEVFDFGYTGDGSAYLAMELLEGESIKTRLKTRGALPERAAADVAYGVAGALAAAHGKGIIHRDLKPDNVFLVIGVDGVERPKVLDFGVAKLVDHRDDHKPTVDGALLGTPRYMAPEQARAASAIDHRADLYSLGCLLYEMIAGTPPFIGTGAGELIAMHMFEEPEPPSARGATITPALEAVILRLLQKEPDARYQSAAETAAAIAKAFEPAPQRRPPRRSTRIAIAAGVITLAIAGGAIAVVAHGLRKPPPPPPPPMQPIIVMPAVSPAPPPAVVAPEPVPLPPKPSHVTTHTRPAATVPKKPATCDGRSGDHDSQCSPIETAP